MCNIQAGRGNFNVNGVFVSSYEGVTIVNGEVTIDGVKMPSCPGKGYNSTLIGNRVYLNGYELVDGKWKKTLRALWHKWF